MGGRNNRWHPPESAEPARAAEAGQPLRVIRDQIGAAEADLREYRPAELDWPTRAAAAADRLIPWLVRTAPGLRSYVQDVLNAPALLRSLWQGIRSQVDLPREQVEAFERQLALDGVLRESVTGEVVSRVVTKYLIDHPPAGGVLTNSRSDYPDVYLAAFDYAGLPAFVRRKRVAAEVQYGAALKGRARRPVRVPDGLEIKTCRDRIAVDCHFPHAGLHLVLLFTEVRRVFTVEDLRVAFLRRSDYRESERSTEATTVKYSFNGDRFATLLSAP